MTEKPDKFKANASALNKPEESLNTLNPLTDAEIDAREERCRTLRAWNENEIYEDNLVTELTEYSLRLIEALRAERLKASILSGKMLHGIEQLRDAWDEWEEYDNLTNTGGRFAARASACSNPYWKIYRRSCKGKGESK